MGRTAILVANPLYGTPTEHTADITAVRAVYDAFARRDLAAMLRHFHEDGKMLTPVTADFAGRDGTAYHGHEGIAQYLADVGRVWEQFELLPADIRAVAGSIIVFGEAHGRRMTGEDVSRRVVWSWRLRDGRVTSVHANDVGAVD